MRIDQSTQKVSPPRRRRKRRSTDEIIDRILKAASIEFERNGFTGATTAAIAKRARVAEPLIFNNFGSKAKLFRDSIFVPMNRHLLDFCSNHLADADDQVASADIARRQYISELEEFIAKHSRKFISLFFAQVYMKADGLDDIDGLQDYFARASSLEIEGLDGPPRIDPKILARLSFATIFSCIVFRDWLFPKGMISDEKINAALTEYVILGLNPIPTPKRNDSTRLASSKRTAPRASR